MKERRLTVTELREPRYARRPDKVRRDRVMPYLRLKGQWLHDLGFEAGEKVRVATSPGRLVITPVPTEGR